MIPDLRASQVAEARRRWHTLDPIPRAEASKETFHRNVAMQIGGKQFRGRSASLRLATVLVINHPPEKGFTSACLTKELKQGERLLARQLLAS